MYTANGTMGFRITVGRRFDTDAVPRAERMDWAAGRRGVKRVLVRDIGLEKRRWRWNVPKAVQMGMRTASRVGGWRSRWRVDGRRWDSAVRLLDIWRWRSHQP